MITGILVALPEELRTLTQSRLKQGDCISVANNILVTLSGAGPENATAATRTLIDRGAKQLISWGCAGALAPQLKAGDLVIPSAILATNNIQLATQDHWSQLIIKSLEQSIKCYNGQLFESGSVINLAQDKAEQYQQTRALAVDMESAALARAAQQAGIPFVAIRSIVDSADQDLPKAIDYAMTAKGVISLPKLMLYLCTHPAELIGLIKLGMNFNSARKTLKKVASQLAQITQAQ
ncbi:MAG: phosphorylase [Methyloprofundus sp.]|nr:phosphorylase [Methyloprofundus sp.]